MPKFSDFSTGVSPGLVLCLFFTLGFYLVGYRLSLSIGLGVLGGLSSGIAIAWWRFEDTPQPTDSNAIVPLQDLAKSAKIETKSHQASLSSRPPRRDTSLLHWLFGRR